MTNIAASIQGRSFASVETTLGTTLVALWDAWMQHRAYRRTLNELRNLSPRSLRDLGYARADLRTIARRAVYEN